MNKILFMNFTKDHALITPETLQMSLLAKTNATYMPYGWSLRVPEISSKVTIYYIFLSWVIWSETID